MEKEDKDSAPSPSYGNGPPWIFKGRAMYQLHLVKSETARAFIPKELKLVEAFGYTLGGFFLAQYDDSPTRKFDELVVLSGIVWNPPTSCAWAARVLVNSEEACFHGRKEVGLPSHVASFTKSFTSSPLHKEKNQTFLDKIGLSSISKRSKEYCHIEVNEIKGATGIPIPVCNLNFPSSETESYFNQSGPMVQLSLPSFSGRTDCNPNLLKYSCKIECRIKPVKPAIVSVINTTSANNGDSTAESMDKELNQSISILLSKPILALEFNSLRMQVEAPVIVPSSYSHAQASLEPKIKIT